jgi:hypothetical protein
MTGYSDPMTVVTIVLTVITLVLAICALWQLGISRRQIRAYMGVSVENELSIVETPGYIDVSIVFHNCGATPAHEVYYHGHLSIFDYPLKGNEFVTPKKFDEVIYAPKIIQANGQFSWMVRGPLKPEEITAIKDGTKERLYLWGELRYRDSFWKRHHTKFAFMFGGPDSIAAKRMQWVELGNEAT